MEEARPARVDGEMATIALATQPDLVPPWDPRDNSSTTLLQERGIGMQKRKVHQRGEGTVLHDRGVLASLTVNVKK